jgi:hypothetical protein
VETYPPGEWIRRRISERVGRLLWTASWITPVPIWISEGDRWRTRGHWYGITVVYPNRPSLAQLGELPPRVRPLLGLVDDLSSAWTPVDVNRAFARFLWLQFGSGNRDGGAQAGPPLWGADP